ncbi:hypothetical protein HYFRA_00007644 [Hymenoscyphus fraxineus]|uniref:Heterokaryon incompatibility domain-containing protein n=1 Tax=Hymenoscyphus fraxineus TaxID=746836 RepID=A0A9N9KSZ9_9HELO|nr:hypothetical protein HYFRA_00007644 [Hymenoscyphus fraxineus]
MRTWQETETRHSKEQLYSRSGLSGFMGMISTTTQDAVQVIKEIRMRYLWTDEICIFEDDPGGKQLLMGSMDAIYARATLTIVAAQGKRIQAHEVRIQVAAAPLKHLLLECLWSTRGWTYQKALLCARLLFSPTNYAVHFTCICTTWSEDKECISEWTLPPWKFSTGSQYGCRQNIGDNTLLAPEREEVDNLGHLFQKANFTIEIDISYDAADIFGLLEALIDVESTFGLPKPRLEEFLF